MLISTQLDQLMNVLGPDKVKVFPAQLGVPTQQLQDSMISKGTASVRSPTRNLQQFSAIVTHKSFMDAVVNEFRKEYSISAPVGH